MIRPGGIGCAERDARITRFRERSAFYRMENVVCRQSDIYISTLRKILFAMGGELIIIAHFDDGDVLINQFDDIRKSKAVA